jgi:predicted nuclease of predicted toxin-antitoxin system
MRLLADENIPAPVVEALRAARHDVAWVREDAPRLPDSEVLSRAGRQGRLLVTLDKDYGELVFQQSMPAPYGIVLLRYEPRSPEALALRLVAALESRDDWAGCFAVVEQDRIRTTPVPEQ